MTRRSRPSLANAVVSGAIASVAALALGGAPVASGAPAGQPVVLADRLGLATQTPFDLPADGTLSFAFELPPALRAGSAEATIVITAYRPLTTQLEVAIALDGQLGRSGDAVDVGLATLPPLTGDQLSITLPTETTERTNEALQLPQPGLYPLLVEWYDGGEVLADLLTFVHRLPTNDEPALVPLPVAVAATVTSPVLLDDTLDVLLTPETIAEFTQLAELLEVTPVAIAVRVPPGLFDALTNAAVTAEFDGGALAQRLANGMVRNDVLSAPRYPLDPSLAAAFGQTALYTQWLRDGEDDLARTVTSPSLRTLAFVDAPLTQAGAALLRDLGARLMVTTPAVFDALPLSTGVFTDLSQLVQFEVAPGVTIDATVTDRIIGPVLARPTSTPTLTGIRAMAHLLAYRQEIVDSNGNPRRHGVTLGTPDLSLPDVTSFAAIATLLGSSPAIQPTTLDTLGVRTDHAVVNGVEVIVALPTEPAGDLTERLQLVDSLSVQAISAGSMLPATDPRIVEWQQVIQLLPTSALSDFQVRALAAHLSEQYTAIRTAIEVPEGFAFTLTGRRTTVPIKLRNTSDIALTVRVRLSSSKLLFPDGDQLVVLPPQSYTEVRVAIETRTNGRFPVTLQVFTPVGDAELAPPVPLTASVNALTGLGNLITGALLLVVLTWWVRQMRTNRRSRAAARALARHPVANGSNDSNEGDSEGDSGTDGDGIAADTATIDDAELSPDAATSTLPPL